MSCIVCLEEPPAAAAAGLQCASGHTICASCLGPYLLEQADRLGKTDLLASKA